MRSIKKSFMAAAMALTLGASSAWAATDTILFDPDGAGGAYAPILIDQFDWGVGSALAVGGNWAFPTVGNTSQLYYQANLATATLLGSLKFANGFLGAPTFTIVSSFTEVITSVGTNTIDLGLAATQVNNYFRIYATPAEGNNLTGQGFIAGTLIMEGTITAVKQSSFTISDTTPTNLDAFNTDNWSGQKTVTGGGSSTIDVTIQLGDVDSNYFPDLFTGNLVSFLFFTTQQNTPFITADPSKCFEDATNNATCDGINSTANLGPVNGLPNLCDPATGICYAPGDPNGLPFLRTATYDFIFQADGSNSFLRGPQVPEPGSLALLGLGLGALGLVARRRSTKQA